MIKFKQNYFYLTVLLFAVEVCIALFLDDRLIRPLVGDVLVVILIYCFLRAFLEIRIVSAIGFVLGLAYAVEWAQYFQIVDRLGWRDNKLLATVVGTTFDWKDLVAYTIGAAIVLGLEKQNFRF